LLLKLALRSRQKNRLVSAKLSENPAQPCVRLIPFSTNIATKPGIITGEASPENNPAAALLFASLRPVPLIIHEETAPGLPAVWRDSWFVNICDVRLLRPAKRR
jgi:hypothetical protein